MTPMSYRVTSTPRGSPPSAPPTSRLPTSSATRSSCSLWPSVLATGPRPPSRCVSIPPWSRVSIPLASVRGAFNAVFVEGDTAGELMVYGRGAGGMATASAVLGDVVAAAHHRREETRGRAVRREHVEISPISALSTQYYLALDVKDQPGVLASVARVFGEHHVSIRSMEQIGARRWRPARFHHPHRCRGRRAGDLGLARRTGRRGTRGCAVASHRPGTLRSQ